MNHPLDRFLSLSTLSTELNGMVTTILPEFSTSSSEHNNNSSNEDFDDDDDDDDDVGGNTDENYNPFCSQPVIF